MTNTQIRKRLVSDFKFLESLGHEVLGVFLVGSQNYKTDTKYSDIDVRGVVVSSFRSVVHNKGVIHEEHIRENGLLTVMDLNSFHENLQKQNPNFLECLFTNHYRLNPFYANEYSTVLENRELIARINPWRHTMAVAGILKKRMEDVFTKKPNNTDRIAKYGFDNKALSESIRMLDLIEKYQKNIPYEECLIPDNHEKLAKLKEDGTMISQVRAPEFKQFLEKLNTRCNNALVDLEKMFDSVENPNMFHLLNTVTELVYLKSLNKLKSFC